MNQETIDAFKKGALSFGITLSDQQLNQFARYQSLLAEWNEKINLTTITEEKEVVVKHFLDSLSGLSVVPFKPGTRVLDIGTGAGFPGMALAIACPNVQFTLMDATAKKVRFLSLAAEELGLSNVEAVQGRAEEFAQEDAFREVFDVVISRAVAALPVLLEYMAGFVKPKGRLMTYKGPSLEEELLTARNAMHVLHLSLREKKEITFASGDETLSHAIAVFEKTDSLDRKYPRPTAQIKKKPL